MSYFAKRSGKIELTVQTYFKDNFFYGALTCDLVIYDGNYADKKVIKLYGISLLSDKKNFK